MENKASDVNVKVERTGMPWWVTAAATLGVGSVIGLVVVFWITRFADRSQQFTQDKFITQSERTIEKLGDHTAATKELSGKVERLVDKQDELNDILKPLTSKLEKVADAVTEQVEQSQEPRP